MISSDSSESSGTMRVLVQREARRKQHQVRRMRQSDELKEQGNQLFKEGKYREALKLYGHALERAVAFKDLIYSNMAAAYLKLGLYDQAEEASTSALIYEPSAIKPRFRRALARKHLGQLRGAQCDLEAVLSQERNCPETTAELEKVKKIISRNPSKVKDAHHREIDLRSPFYVSHAAWESEIESDSSDCHHHGNESPCRSYNKDPDGCKKGANCPFSHALDKRSVRDRLGRNVCLYHLIYTCKAGDSCRYSHSLDYLPNDCWLLKTETNLPAIQLYVIDCIAYGRPLVRADARRAVWEYMDGLGSSEDESGEERSEFKSKFPSQQVHVSLNELFPDAERFVLLVILDQSLPLSKTFEHFASTLQSRIKIETVLNHTAILKYLSTPGITGVIVGDAGIAERDEMRRVCKHLAEYVRSGGTVIVSGSFAATCYSGYLGDFFRILDSGWKSGPKYSTTMVLNSQHATAQESPSLDESIIMMAAHVTSISSTDVLYMPTPNSSTAPPENGSDTTHAPIVGRRVGRGYVGYIGDLDFGGNNSNSCSNLDSASIKVIFAMLGLLDTTDTTPSINSVPVPNAHATAEAETNPEPAAEVVNMTPL